MLILSEARKAGLPEMANLSIEAGSPVSILTKVIKPRTLTECVFDRSAGGRLKHLYWRYVLNPVRSLKRSQDDDRYDSEIARLAGELTKKGLVLEDAGAFLSEEGRRALEEAKAFVRKLSQSDEVQAILQEGANKALGKDYLVQVVPFDRAQEADSPLLKLALDPKLLRTVARYMGLWPRLHAIGSWLNFPTDNDAKHSQLWHRDPEDLKTVKVFIYLEDVAKENGPFSYICNTHPFGSACDRVPEHVHPRRVTDDEMQHTLPAESWFECTGPANTMIIVDTVGYHRGGYVKSGRRFLITFTYTSGRPQEKRELRVRGTPDWLGSPIQRYAL